MRYDLLYFKDVPQPNGDDVRLEVYVGVPDDTLLHPIPQPFGDVLAGLRLNVEGYAGDIDEPIVKTSLSFDLVDAPERNTSSEKWGNWEFFYTSNAVGYRIVLLGKRKGETEYAKLWSGYVTPDSYKEVLQHHGIVTITARDNIGHLQDFEFDAEGNEDGMITLYELIEQAWAKIESPMALDWRGAADENYWPRTGGVDATDTYMNVSAFEGKTWYDAVSETLYSYGLVLRYVGRNRVSVCPLARMPEQGCEGLGIDLETKVPLFEAYATRELMPSVKEIRDEVKYELEEGQDIPIIKDADFTGETLTCTVNAVDIFGSVKQKEVVVWPVANEGDTGWGNIKSNTLFFNPFAYPNLLEEQTTIDKDMFLATNTNDRMVWYGKYINCQRMELGLEYGPMIVKRTNGIMRALNAREVESITGAIKLTINGLEYYYDGSQFKAEYKELTMPFEEGVMRQGLAFHKLNGQRGLLQLFIFRVNVDWTLGYPDMSGDEGVYLGFKPLNFSIPYVGSLMEKNTIRTVYDEANNLIMSRTPAFGPVYDEVAMPGLISNGIFRKDGGNYVTTPKWQWYWQAEDEGEQLGVMIHRQLLCYHSKPNNLITGTILNADLLDPRCVWLFKGNYHLLLGGTFNFLNGRIEGAELREYRTYQQLWETWIETPSVTVDYVATEVQLAVYSKKEITEDMVTAPSWISVTLERQKDKTIAKLEIQANRTGSTRVGRVIIDRAGVQVEQLKAGDYNTDYSISYS